MCTTRLLALDPLPPVGDEHGTALGLKIPVLGKGVAKLVNKHALHEVAHEDVDGDVGGCWGLVGEPGWFRWRAPLYRASWVLLRICGELRWCEECPRSQYGSSNVKLRLLLLRVFGEPGWLRWHVPMYRAS